MWCWEVESEDVTDESASLGHKNAISRLHKLIRPRLCRYDRRKTLLTQDSIFARSRRCSLYLLQVFYTRGSHLESDLVLCCSDTANAHLFRRSNERKKEILLYMPLHGETRNPTCLVYLYYTYTVEIRLAILYCQHGQLHRKMQSGEDAIHMNVIVRGALEGSRADDRCQFLVNQGRWEWIRDTIRLDCLLELVQDPRDV